MGQLQKAWTTELDSQLLALRAQGMPYPQIVPILGKSLHACRSRHTFLSKTPEQLRAIKDRKNARARLEHYEKFGIRRGSQYRRVEETKPILVPDDVWAERNARLATIPTIGQLLLGEPHPSRSALAQKMGVGA